MEPAVLPWLFHFRGPVAPPEEIVIVIVNEGTFKELGLSSLEPLPRSAHARLLDVLARYGAKKVFLDIVFKEEGRDPVQDREFAEALKKLPVSIAAYQKYYAQTGLDGAAHISYEMYYPQKMFAQSAEHVLLANVILDNDVVRRFKTGVGTLNDCTPMAEFIYSGRCEGQVVPGVRDFINYYGPPGSIPTVSYADLLHDRFPDQFQRLRGKMVFVGLHQETAVGVAWKDAFATSYGVSSRFGVEIHATAAGNILRRDWIRRASFGVEMIALNVAAFVVTFMLLQLAPLKALAFACSCAGFWAVAAYVCFLNNFFLPGFVLMFILLPFVLLVAVSVYYWILRRSFGRVESALGVKIQERR